MKIIAMLIIVITILGCESKSSNNSAVTVAAPEKQQQASLPAAPPAADKTPAIPARLSVSGKVLEVIDVTDGIYMRLTTSEGEIWVAVNKATVKKGAEVKVTNAVRMDGFESKKLGRKFDHILFGTLSTGSTQTVGEPDPSSSGTRVAGTKQAVEGKHPALSNPSVDAGNIKVSKAEGAEGKTVAEIYASKAMLKDAPVSLRGKVVKVNSGIMGKNWLHLRDGSGSPEKQDNDITVTTLDSATVGDVILIKGVVHLDRDLGSGYMYPVIIEDAKISK